MADELEAQMQSLVDGLCALDYDSAVTVMTSVLQARPELAPPVVNFSVPDLTYPPSKALIERRSEGTIKSFNETKGFGFIDCRELNETFGNDVFIHHAQMSGGLSVGEHVTFAVMLNKENKPQGYDLQPGKGGGKMGGGKDGMKGGWGDDWGKGGMKGGGMKGGMLSPMGGGGGGGILGPGSGGGGGGMLGPGAKGMAKGCGGCGKGFGGYGGKGDDKGKGKSKGNFLGATMTDDAAHIGDYEGTIKSFNEKNGYGFIDCADLKAEYNNDCFLHHNDLASFGVGDNVSFAVFLNSAGKPQAKNLTESSGSKRPRY